LRKRSEGDNRKQKDKMMWILLNRRVKKRGKLALCQMCRPDPNFFIVCFLSFVLCLLSSVAAQAATEFESTIKQDGTGCYTSLTTWEAANQCDLITSAALSHGGITGTIVDGSYVKGAVSGAFGTVVHCTSTQICIKDMTGTFQNAEQMNKTVSLDGTISSPAANVTASSAPASVIAVAKIDGSWTRPESSVVTIDGWTTAVDNYIRIYTTSAARHNGAWSDVIGIDALGTWSDVSGVYTMEVNGTNLIDIKENYVRIKGLQLHLINSTDITGIRGINIDPQVANTGIIINSNIIRGTISGTSSEGIGIYGNDSEITAKIYNNIIYGFINGSVANNAGVKTATGGTYYIYNNTIYGNYEGVNASAGTVVAKNNLCNGNTTDYLGSFSTASRNNLSEDTTAPEYGNYYQSKQVTFEDEAGTPPDYRLAAADAEAKETGTSLLADPNGFLSFSEDISGETRPIGDLWDIGADESGDTTDPVLNSVVASSIAAADDTIALTFNEIMDTSTISTGCSTLVIRYSDDGSGTNAVVIPTRYATVVWSAGDTVATITLDKSE